MERGFWATWYDLDAQDAAGHLAWLHAEHLPRLAATPGWAWVAHYRYVGGGEQMDAVKSTVVSHTDDDIGGGTQYLLIAGAGSPHVFFAPRADQAPVDPATAGRLAQRRGARTAAFVQEARVEGPAGPGPTPLSPPSPAIQFGTLRARTVEAEFDLIAWYAQYRLPAMSRMPGCVRTRKLSGIAGWPRHGILYEFESLQARLSHFEQGHEHLALDPAQWTGRITRASWHAPGSPFIGERTWPPVGG